MYAVHKKDEISGSDNYGNVSELINETLNHTDLDPCSSVVQSSTGDSSEAIRKRQRFEPVQQAGIREIPQLAPYYGQAFWVLELAHMQRPEATGITQMRRNTFIDAFL